MKYFLSSILILSSATARQISLEKPNKLLLFATATFTGYEPRDGRVCQAAMQVAADTVNSRRDILPDYSIEVDYRDEGSGAINSPRAFISFLRDAQTRMADDPKVSIAPAVVGTAMGCHRLTSLTREMKVVQFTPGCSGEQFSAKRNLYPYLYRNRVPAEFQYIPPVIFFLQENRQAWNQIGVLNFDPGARPQNAVTTAGRQVVYNPVISELDDRTMLEMKQSDARILLVQIGTASLYLNFLCRAWQYGLTAPTHIFMTTSSNFIDPLASDLKLPSGCNREILRKQVEITFWGGPFDFALEDNGPTTFGYGLKEFEDFLDDLTNSSRSADYVRRHRCFDAMEQALLALDQADRLLKERSSLSLSSFTEQPTEVLKVVNETAAHSDFVGLRIGRIKYSERLELDNEGQYLTQYVDGKMRVIYRVSYNGTVADVNQLHNLSRYVFKKIEEPVWFTKDGSAPKDLSSVKHYFDRFSDEAFGALIVLSFSALIVIVFFCYILWKYRNISTVVFMPKIDFLTICGAIFGNFAAIVNAMSDQQSNICNAQAALAVISLSLVNGIVVFKMVEFVRKLHSAKTHIKVGKINSAAVETPKIDTTKWQREIMVGVVLFVCLNVLVMSAMLATDPISMQRSASLVMYDQILDSYTDTSRLFCQSHYLFSWSSALAGFHLLLLILAAFLAYEVRKAVTAPNLVLDLKTTRFVAMNAVTIFAAVFFLFFVIPSDQTTLKAMLMAFGLFIHSNSCSLIMLYPIFVQWRERLLSKGRNAQVNQTPMATLA